MNTISNDTRIALLCELAHDRIKEDGQNGDLPNIYIIPNNDGDGTKYTDEGQELFNYYYDNYECMILNHLDLVDNPNYKKEED